MLHYVYVDAVSITKRVQTADLRSTHWTSMPNKPEIDGVLCFSMITGGIATAEQSAILLLSVTDESMTR